MTCSYRAASARLQLSAAVPHSCGFILRCSGCWQQRLCLAGRYVGGNLRPAEGDLAVSSPDRDEVLTVVDEPGAADARHSRPTLRIRRLQATNAVDRDEDRIVRQLVELLRRESEQSQASLL